MSLILPTQLFLKNKILKEPIFIYEHPVYFTKYKYHKMKLVLHRASMKCYYDYIKKQYSDVTYINFNSKLPANFKNLTLYDPVDYEVIKELKKYKITAIDTPAFLTKIDELQEYLDTGGIYKQTSFYIWQRRRLNILMDKNNKPVGGKWTYDKENRNKYPSDFKDKKFASNKSKYVIEAKKYIDKYFPDNYGEYDLYLPIDHKGAKIHLKNFIKNKLECFGPYQDAVDNKVVFGCHSVLSPLLNIGLLTPSDVLEEIIKYKTKHIASLEGFIRQLIGWREYMRMVYIYKHHELITNNYFKHDKKLSKEWYNGTFFIEPINDSIKKVLQYGYTNHIERLMYLGNTMLLMQIKPKEVHDWFMIMFIDSYHVFMEPNVYGMSQYSSNDVMVARPYFSSSNYILKMSSYKRGDWCDYFDALFYNFLNRNKSLSKIYAYAAIYKYWERKKDKEKILKLAKEIIEYGIIKN